MTVHRFTGGHLRSNAYVVEYLNAGELFVVDSGMNDESLVESLMLTGKPVSAVLLTHGHFDHAGTAAKLSQVFGCPVYLSRDDVRVLNRNNFLLRSIGLTPDFVTPNCELVAPNFSLGDFKFHHVPGHTPGSVMISNQKLVFTGDTVYAKGTGIGQLPGENIEMLRESIRNHIALLVQSQLVLPGHGNCIGGSELFWNNNDLREFAQVSM